MYFINKWRNVFYLSLILSGLTMVDASVVAQESQLNKKYQTTTPRAGEKCFICGMELTDNDLVLIVRGRRVPLNKAMVDSFLNHPDFFFSKLQPRSALFQENLDAPAGTAQGGISLTWFLFGLFILQALIFAGLSGYRAVSRGLSPVPNFMIGLLFSIFGYLYVCSRKAVVKKEAIPKGLVKVPDTHAPVPCAKCHQTNHPSASHCSGCGAELIPLYKSEVSRIG